MRGEVEGEDVEDRREGREEGGGGGRKGRGSFFCGKGMVSVELPWEWRSRWVLEELTVGEVQHFLQAVVDIDRRHCEKETRRERIQAEIRSLKKRHDIIYDGN